MTGRNGVFLPRRAICEWFEEYHTDNQSMIYFTS